jgi:hypothetical protein
MMDKIKHGDPKSKQVQVQLVISAVTVHLKTNHLKQARLLKMAAIFLTIQKQDTLSRIYRWAT